MSNIPKQVLLFSGKRKSGKDFIAENICNTLGAQNCEIIRISHPIKAHWAAQKSLSLEELLGDTQYKEKYRKEMIEWSEQVRNNDYGYFCKEACKSISRPICIVSDVRRKTDIKWFKDEFGDKVKTIRIVSDNRIREARGWKFVEGVDDVASECDLDDYKLWDLVVVNNNDVETEELIKPILNQVKG